ncbi:hypothetical protein BW727_101726 [Jeotgalibaca dankookensis]|uniref:Cyclic di-AMP receptor A n=1 Tax=Jeotgalibaca dankookensis TaxID=708126 RepID=A0A1S6IRB3_9LACT|nr:cyclic-di-AMP receptor [Jeotgalibaca dankookensis]AQS54091.1 hypothetical protein BW727_101726 [Jeotgalibaca dankookensis]
MKMIMAVVQDKDSALLSDELVEANVRATKLSSSGGFLRSGNTTFMIGVEDERVEEVLNIIKINCESREQYMTTPVNDLAMSSSMQYPIQVHVGGATVFVLPVESFHRF